MEHTSHSNAVAPHTLYVVATPIGHLGDLSPRAREVLMGVDSILCEDTRHTQKLLNAIGARTPMLSFHEHNEKQRVDELLQRLSEGQSLALVSDAGTPLISDPGFRLVQAAHEWRPREIHVVTIPGPSAVIAALSIAGVPTDRFVFEGFLPNSDAKVRQALTDARVESRTMVFYEAPHRIKNTLKIASECFGPDRSAVLARELTKRFECVYKGTLAQLNDLAISDPNMARGELVLIIEGADRSDPAREEQPWRPALELFLSQLPVRTAVDWVCQLYGVKRNPVYEAAIAHKSAAPQNPSEP